MSLHVVSASGFNGGQLREEKPTVLNIYQVLRAQGRARIEMDVFFRVLEAQQSGVQPGSRLSLEKTDSEPVKKRLEEFFWHFHLIRDKNYPVSFEVKEEAVRSFERLFCGKELEHSFELAKEILLHPAFKGFSTSEDTYSLLKGAEKGVYCIRYSSRLLKGGSFTIDAIWPSNEDKPQSEYLFFDAKKQKWVIDSYPLIEGNSLEETLINAGLYTPCTPCTPCQQIDEFLYELSLRRASLSEDEYTKLSSRLKELLWYFHPKGGPFASPAVFEVTAEARQNFERLFGSKELASSFRIVREIFLHPAFFGFLQAGQENTFLDFEQKKHSGACGIYLLRYSSQLAGEGSFAISAIWPDGQRAADSLSFNKEANMWVIGAGYQANSLDAVLKLAGLNLPISLART